MVIDEIDYHAQLEELGKSEPLEQHPTVKCEACGAEADRPPNVTSLACPFCTSPMVALDHCRKLIKPKSLLPFSITRESAVSRFREWMHGLWFAPSDLKTFARSDQAVTGMYVPYWTYDCNTVTPYSGQRGDDYYVTESYTALVNGKSVARTRQVKKTRWRDVSGVVRNTFDDLLVPASHSLPDQHIHALEPWDLNNLAPYKDEYLAGFRAESYQVELADGFDIAKTLMDPAIRGSIHSDIGGDHQRISHMQPQYNDITYKHVLLPIWISAYRYRDRVFRFLVNARTGEVQGERPYSGWKIGLTIAAVVVVAIVAVFFLAR